MDIGRYLVLHWEKFWLKKKNMKAVYIDFGSVARKLLGLTPSTSLKLFPLPWTGRYSTTSLIENW